MLVPFPPHTHFTLLLITFTDYNNVMAITNCYGFNILPMLYVILMNCKKSKRNITQSEIVCLLIYNIINVCDLFIFTIRHEKIFWEIKQKVGTDCSKIRL